MGAGAGTGCTTGTGMLDAVGSCERLAELIVYRQLEAKGQLIVWSLNLGLHSPKRSCNESLTVLQRSIARYEMLPESETSVLHTQRADSVLSIFAQHP